MLSINSFSKILAPGLRLGWVQAAPSHIQRLVNSGLLDSGGGLNPFTSALVRVVLEEGMQDDYLAHLHATYRARIAVLNDALRAELGDLASFTMPEGGYFFWVRLTEGYDAGALMAHAPATRSASAPACASPAATGCATTCASALPFMRRTQLAAGARRLAGAIADYAHTR